MHHDTRPTFAPDALVRQDTSVAFVHQDSSVTFVHQDTSVICVHQDTCHLYTSGHMSPLYIRTQVSSLYIRTRVIFVHHDTSVLFVHQDMCTSWHNCHLCASWRKCPLCTSGRKCHLCTSGHASVTFVHHDTSDLHTSRHNLCHLCTWGHWVSHFYIRKQVSPLYIRTRVSHLYIMTQVTFIHQDTTCVTFVHQDIDSIECHISTSGNKCHLCSPGHVSPLYTRTQCPMLVSGHWKNETNISASDTAFWRVSLIFLIYNQLHNVCMHELIFHAFDMLCVTFTNCDWVLVYVLYRHLIYIYVIYIYVLNIYFSEGVAFVMTCVWSITTAITAKCQNNRVLKHSSHFE